MKKLILSSLFLLASWSFAAEEMGLTPQETYQLKTEGETPVLFIDVRDPVEIMFVGSTDVIDLNIPFLIVDRTEWSDERGAFKMNKNDQFAEEVAAALEAKNLPKDTMIITMCRSGSERGKPSAEALREAGFSNAHYVVNGFQGDAVKTGEMKGFRIQNGWQNSELPWDAKMSGEKIYRTDNKIEEVTAEKKVEPATIQNNTNSDAKINEEVAEKVAEVVDEKNVEKAAATTEATDKVADKITKEATDKANGNKANGSEEEGVAVQKQDLKGNFDEIKEDLNSATNKAKEIFVK